MAIRFGDCEIDLDQVEIRRNGMRIPVQPQVFSVIEYLLANRDRVVSRDELLDNVWGDRFVSDSTVNSRIKFARRALGDTGSEQSVIRTVPGRGYRFVAEIDDIDEADEADLPIFEWPLVGRYVDVERIADLAQSTECGGVLLTGPARIGKSAIASAARDRLASLGFQTMQVSALVATADVPLAALASMLPDGMLDEIDIADDLAQGLVFRRARDAVRSVASEGRLVVAVDDADRLDPLSIALLSSLVTDGAVFLIATQQTSPAATLAFDELVRNRVVRCYPIEPLSDPELDLVMYRALEGRIEPDSMRRLGEYSSGFPGLLRELIDSSLESGSLVRYDGVWRLTGPLTRRGDVWPDPSLGPSSVRAAEVLALVGEMRIETALALMGDDAVDELDRHGYLSLVEASGEAIVSFADPLLVDAIVALITPVRKRRHQEDLVAALASNPVTPHVAALVAKWAAELGHPQEPLEMLLAAQRALNRGADDAAETLTELVDSATIEYKAYVDAIRAEISLRRSQFDRAEALLHGLATDDLDETTRSFVYRRMVTVRCYARSEYAESAEWLEHQAALAPPAIAASLLCNRVHMLAMTGRVDEAVALSDSLANSQAGLITELSEVERTLSTARAEYLGGNLTRALAVLDRHDETSAHVAIPGVAVEDPLEASRAIRLSCWLALGEIREAQSLIRAESIARRRATRSWVTLAAAEVELEAGRSRLAREMVRRAVDNNRRQGLRMGRIASEAMFARTSAMLGMYEEANGFLDELLIELPSVGASNSWYVSEAAARTAQLLGRADELHDTLLAHADEAGGLGACLSRATLLVTAATTSSDPTFAASTLADLKSLSDQIGGALWPIRVAHVQAIGQGGDLATVANEYRDLGYHALAATCVRD